MAIDEKAIIFFDGVCGMCNSFVDWLIVRDKENKFLYAPIQGETYKAHGGKLVIDPALWSIAYLKKDGTFQHASTAVLDILVELGGAWRAMAVFKILPAGFRDLFYRFIARRRYGWFGKMDKCRIPSISERSKFLP